MPPGSAAAASPVDTQHNTLSLSDNMWRATFHCTTLPRQQTAPGTSVITATSAFLYATSTDIHRTASADGREGPRVSPAHIQPGRLRNPGLWDTAQTMQHSMPQKESPLTRTFYISILRNCLQTFNAPKVKKFSTSQLPCGILPSQCNHQH